MVIDAISFEQCDDQSQREHKQVQKNGQRKDIKNTLKPLILGHFVAEKEGFEPSMSY